MNLTKKQQEVFDLLADGRWWTTEKVNKALGRKTYDQLIALNKKGALRKMGGDYDREWRRPL